MLPNTNQTHTKSNQPNPYHPNQNPNPNQWINNTSFQANSSFQQNQSAWSQSSIAHLSSRKSAFPTSLQNSMNIQKPDLKPVYQSRFNLLPRINDFSKILKTDSSIPQGKFLTNYYEFNEKSIAQAFIYTVQTIPVIPADSSDKWYRVVRSIKKKLERSIGLITFRNNTLWGRLQTHPTQIITTLGGNRFKGPQQTASYNNNQPTEKYQVRYYVTGKIAMQQLCADRNQKADRNEKIKPLYIQMINNRIKEKMQALGFAELGKGRFYWLQGLAKREGNIKSAGLNVMHGYRFTLTCINPTKNYVQIDTCSRILRIGNFLEEIDKCEGSASDKNAYFRGATLLARYGKYKTYTLQSIEFGLHPTSTFKMNVNGVETDVSYATYFQKCYNITVTNMQQPMIKAIGKVEKRIEKGNKFTKTPQVVFLVPQLLSLTGMSQEQRTNYQVMKEVAEKTKLQPIKRFQMCSTMIEALKKQKDAIQIGNPVTMEGYKLKRPIIKLGKKQETTDQNGSFAFQQPIIDPLDLKTKEWIMVSSNYTPTKDVEIFYNTMRTAGEVYDITIDLPFSICVQYTANCSSTVWIQAIKQCLSQNYLTEKPSIIVLVLQESEINLYNDIKRYCCRELKLFTQFFKASTLSSDKKCMSAAGKIILQIAAKIGKRLWTVPPQHAYWKDRMVATASLSYSRGLKNSYTMAMVGTTNETLTSVYTYCMVGLGKREQVAMQIYCNFFEKWLSEYLARTKRLPDTLIVYREGLSDAQIKVTVGQELEQLYYVIEQRIRKYVKGYEKYNPEVVFMTVNKKVNSKFYDCGVTQNKQKWVRNPTSGSVVFCEMASNGQIDFYLTPMRVSSGTATPCQYRIIYYNAKDQEIAVEKKAGGAIPQQTDKKTELPLQALAQLTYEQCFNYYNWQGAVRIPSVMQNADKLSKLAGEHIQSHMNYVDFENSYRQLLMQSQASEDERNKRLQAQRFKFHRIICSLYFL